MYTDEKSGIMVVRLNDCVVPDGLQVGDALLELELHQGQDLEGDKGVEEGLRTVNALVSPTMIR